MKKTFISILLFIMIIVGFKPTIISFSNSSDDKNNVKKIIEEIINWKKSDVGASQNESIYTNEMLSLVGTTAGDWYTIGLGRYNYEEEYSSYLAVINDVVENKYETSNKLDKVKATEWHRIALAVSACGGNPLAMGTSGDINLIKDGTYDRGLTLSPGRQGVNGWIWSLIAVDSKRYEIPQDSCNTRDDFIVEIIKTQRSDGGFALTGSVSDVDITAMALIALAPYYNNEKEYNYISSVIKDENNKYIECNKLVRTVIDESISWLSNVQLDDGDFESWGMENVESTAQVIVALNSLGIDALNDPRFIKNGNNLLDGILKYRLDNGGFIHSFTYDPDNPTSKPDEANSMAGEQVLYAMVSIWRYQNKMRTLYDMRDEFSEEERQIIDNVISKIDNLNNLSTKEDVIDVLNKYIEVDELDRCYVANYIKLVNYATKFNIDLPSYEPIYDDNNNQIDSPLLYFSESNKKTVDSLPLDDRLTTEYYSTVTTLLYLIKNTEDFEGKDKYLIKLEKAYNQITEIQKQIDEIKKDIKENLYPFDNISLNDKEIIYSIYERFISLSEYDQNKFEPSDVEGIMKCKVEIDNLYLAITISSIGIIICDLILVIIIIRINKRRKEKAMKLMPESDE